MPAKSPQWIIDIAREAYLSGLSIRQIANKIGYHYGTVGRWVEDIWRDRYTAAILRQPPKSKHWRSCRAAARKAMERYLKEHIPSNMVVHHINEDYTDNRISNLEIMTRGDHIRLHKLGKVKNKAGKYVSPR